MTKDKFILRNNSEIYSAIHEKHLSRETNLCPHFSDNDQFLLKKVCLKKQPMSTSVSPAFHFSDSHFLTEFRVKLLKNSDMNKKVNK